MRILRTALLSVAGGIVIALLLFELTISPSHILCCPVNTIVTDPGGINPWTGEDRPMTVARYDNTDTDPVIQVWEHDRNPFIPLPVGFVFGSLVTLTVVTIERRRRVTPPPAVSPA